MLEFFDLGPDLGKAPLDEGQSVTTGALPPVEDIEQLLDVGELKPHSLTLFDEPEPVEGLIWIASVPGSGSVGWVQETDALVVAHRVGLHADPSP